MNVLLPYSKMKRVSGSGELRIGKPIDFDEDKIKNIFALAIMTQLNNNVIYDNLDIETNTLKEKKE